MKQFLYFGVLLLTKRLLEHQMQINNYNYFYSPKISRNRINIQNKNTVSFTSCPVCDVNIKTKNPYGQYDLMPATFSELNVTDEEDLLAVMNIHESWINTDYGKGFCNSFYNEKEKNNKRKYWVIENNNSLKPLADRILSLMKTEVVTDSDKNKTMFVCFLQSSPKICNAEIKNIKGVGEMNLGMAINLAKKENCNQLKIISTNDDFYKHVGNFKVEESFDKEGSVLYLDKTQFDETLINIKNKYFFRSPYLQ